jgi:hypothetical protein
MSAVKFCRIGPPGTHSCGASKISASTLYLG